jgi:hypothetical protein
VTRLISGGHQGTWPTASSGRRSITSSERAATRSYRPTIAPRVSVGGTHMSAEGYSIPSPPTVAD